MPLHNRLPHLSDVWISNPIYFITTCTYNRRKILTIPSIAQILTEEWAGAMEKHGWMVGRYVIMPDHVHFFCASLADGSDPKYKDLPKFIQQWKQWTSKRIIRETGMIPTNNNHPIWQKEYFDHLLRSDESYNQKWEYVRENPVRQKIAHKADTWQFQGEIFDLT